MHKQIEDAMQIVEFYYPISLLCILVKVNGNEPYRFIQMRKEDFMYYEKSAKMLRFNLIPYSKVAIRKITIRKTQPPTGWFQTFTR